MIRGLAFRPCWIWPFWDFYRKFLETEKAANRRRAREHRDWLRERDFASITRKEPK